jgi:hypothetical protein
MPCCVVQAHFELDWSRQEWIEDELVRSGAREARLLEDGLVLVTVCANSRDAAEDFVRGATRASEREGDRRGRARAGTGLTSEKREPSRKSGAARAVAPARRTSANRRPREAAHAPRTLVPSAGVFHHTNEATLRRLRTTQIRALGCC